MSRFWRSFAGQLWIKFFYHGAVKMLTWAAVSSEGLTGADRCTCKMVREYMTGLCADLAGGWAPLHVNLSLGLHVCLHDMATLVS